MAGRDAAGNTGMDANQQQEKTMKTSTIILAALLLAGCNHMQPRSGYVYTPRAFAPGSGYGYDVAVGISRTRGGPMTALGGGLSYANRMRRW